MGNDSHSICQKSPQTHVAKKRPTAATIDSQSTKTSAIGGEERGYDGGKMIKGGKRFILTDTQGLLLTVYVCAASVSEKAGAMLLLQYIKNTPYLARLCGRIKLVWVDVDIEVKNSLSGSKNSGIRFDLWSYAPTT